MNGVPFESLALFNFALAFFSLPGKLTQFKSKVEQNISASEIKILDVTCLQNR